MRDGGASGSDNTVPVQLATVIGRLIAIPNTDISMGYHTQVRDVARKGGQNNSKMFLVAISVMLMLVIPVMTGTTVHAQHSFAHEEDNRLVRQTEVVVDSDAGVNEARQDVGDVGILSMFHWSGEAPTGIWQHGPDFWAHAGTHIVISLTWTPPGSWVQFGFACGRTGVRYTRVDFGGCGWGWKVVEVSGLFRPIVRNLGPEDHVSFCALVDTGK